MATLDKLTAQGVDPRSAAVILRAQLDDVTAVLGTTSTELRGDNQVAFELFRQNLQQSIYLLNQRHPHDTAEPVDLEHEPPLPSLRPSSEAPSTAIEENVTAVSPRGNNNETLPTGTTSTSCQLALPTSEIVPARNQNTNNFASTLSPTDALEPPCTERDSRALGVSTKRKRQIEDDEPSAILRKERLSKRARRHGDTFIHSESFMGLIANSSDDGVENTEAIVGLLPTPSQSKEVTQDDTQRIDVGSESPIVEDRHREKAIEQGPRSEMTHNHDGSQHSPTYIKQEDQHNDMSNIPSAESPGVCSYPSCVACETICIEVETAEGICKHDYCQECLENMFKSSLTDDGVFPPHCCHGPISLESVREYLTTSTIRAFERKTKEVATPNKTYCHVAVCSAWIEPENVKDDKGTCSECRKVTCTICKGATHDGDCPKDEGLQQVLALGEAQKWQRCLKCRTMVEKEYGCNHMR